MARGRPTSLSVQLTPVERHTLLAWQRSTTTVSAGRARRGRMILLVADGMPISAVAATVGISRRHVYKWVQRFLEKGVEGLTDKPGRGSWRVSRQPALTERHASDVGERQPVAC
jgi:biotin operon repressor